MIGKMLRIEFEDGEILQIAPVPYGVKDMMVFVDRPDGTEIIHMETIDIAIPIVSESDILIVWCLN